MPRFRENGLPLSRVPKGPSELLPYRRTLRTHVRSMLSKPGAEDGSLAVTVAMRRGIVDA